MPQQGVKRMPTPLRLTPFVNAMRPTLRKQKRNPQRSAQCATATNPTGRSTKPKKPPDELRAPKPMQRPTLTANRAAAATSDQQTRDAKNAQASAEADSDRQPSRSRFLRFAGARCRTRP